VKWDGSFKFINLFVKHICICFHHRWVKDLFRKGYDEDLEVEDLYDTLPSDRSEMLGDELEK
jgi:hypothetical protein